LEVTIPATTLPKTVHRRGSKQRHKPHAPRYIGAWTIWKGGGGTDRVRISLQPLQVAYLVWRSSVGDIWFQRM